MNSAGEDPTERRRPAATLLSDLNNNSNNEMAKAVEKADAAAFAAATGPVGIMPSIAEAGRVTIQVLGSEWPAFNERLVSSLVRFRAHEFIDCHCRRAF